MKNKKMVLTLVLTTVIAISAYTQQYDPEIDFLTAQINGGKEIAITKYVGPKQTVRIPPTIKKLPVTSIGSWAFYDCLSLTALTLPNSVTSIEEGAFAGCTNLASINIPNSVTSIGEFAFYNCTSLASINIPNSVTSIVNGAFLGCTGLITITVAADNNRYSSQDGVLFNKSKNVLIQYPGGKTGSYTIPNGVTSIGAGAFRYSGLTSVTIPNSVTSIGELAFAESGLTGITIPNSIVIIRNNTFDGCANLTSVTMPNSITSIGEHAFAESGITNISIPITVTTIGSFAFAECSSLTNVTFQGSISANGFSNDAFDGVGDLRDKHLAGGPGRYMRQGRNSQWAKQ